MLAFEINRAVKAGQPVTAIVPGMDGAQKVLAARNCFGDLLQVKVVKDGQTRFLNVAPSSVKIENERHE